jgi:glycosyltransferase involved in cell wall biosynthesis
VSELDLSVIVPCHDEEDTLGAQLDALLAQDWDGSWEVIVVDNRSTDRTAALAASYAGRDVPVRVISAADGRGVAYARNAGVRASTASAVAFCDGDDVVAPGWTAAMGDALHRHELVVGTLDPDLLNEPWLSASRPMGGARELPRFGGTPFARGNNCGMQRTLWERLDGYREDFDGLEDIELSLRAAATGAEAVLVPDAVVAYRFRPGIRALWRQGVFYGRGRPALYRQSVRLGLTPPSRWAGLRSWGWLVLRLPTLVSRRGRAAWTWTLANRWGVLRGAVEHRVLFV